MTDAARPERSIQPKLELRETLNFWLTNRLPRNLLTRFIGWFSRIKSPWLARRSIAIWRCLVDDRRLDEAEKQRFNSLHDCFVRRLKPGARPVDQRHGILVSPCDAEVGAMGRIQQGQLLQAKGLSYSLSALLADPLLAEQYHDAVYVTLRLKSSMYHRFHAPHDCSVKEVRYIAGEVFNVNPPTLARLSGVFVRNERAVLPLHIDSLGQAVILVPVAAILVASIRFHCLDLPLNQRYQGPKHIHCQAHYRRGEEMGWFEHGSTIIALARSGLTLNSSLETGQIIRMGWPLFAAVRRPSPAPPSAFGF
ncbi:MAG: archaetidylserine decarboxylase [Wenzhouxiangella sp.]|nr:archaetidylserine decarboxylase [Wenzhouxiangella sp.]